MSILWKSTIAGVEVTQDREDLCVRYISNGDVDADGANGQSIVGGKHIYAYAPGNRGIESLKNAGYPKYPNSYRDILICDKQDPPQPIDFGVAFGGGYHSSTAYIRHDRQWDDPDRYLNAYEIPYIVTNPTVRRKAKGIVLGCKGRITHLKLKKSIDAVVGDTSGPDKIGEFSIAAARALGLNSDPRAGGEEKNVILYEFWPDIPAEINGETFRLLRAGS